LTAAGRRYLEQIDPAIRQIQAATEAILRPTGRNVVRMTLPPSLAATWLIPQLGAFEREHPDVEVQLVSTTRVLDLKRDQVDLAVRHGKGSWPGVDAAFLLNETALPVSAPGYLTVRPGEDPLGVLERVRLIVNARFPNEWEEWARARGLAPPALTSAIELEGLEQALQVAESGHGLAIGRRPMVDDRLARGTLVAPFGAATRPVRPTTSAGRPAWRRPRWRGAWSAGCAGWPLLLESHSSKPESNSLAPGGRRAHLSGRWKPRPLLAALIEEASREPGCPRYVSCARRPPELCRHQRSADLHYAVGYEAGVPQLRVHRRPAAGLL
jgi:DNA-binding transcriptional LysR family regulator